MNPQSMLSNMVYRVDLRVVGEARKSRHGAGQSLVLEAHGPVMRFYQVQQQKLRQSKWVEEVKVLETYEDKRICRDVKDTLNRRPSTYVVKPCLLAFQLPEFLVWVIF